MTRITLKQYTDFAGLLPPLTPKTDRIAAELVRIVADVLDFEYDYSGTTVDSVYIHARRTKRGIKIRVFPIE